MFMETGSICIIIANINSAPDINIPAPLFREAHLIRGGGPRKVTQQTGGLINR